MGFKNIYINLETKDILRSKEFYTGIGFEFISGFSDDTTISFKATENIVLILMNSEKFIGFTKSGITDSMKDKEVFLSFEVGSIEEVEEIATKVLKFGGTISEPIDDDIMYVRAFKDIDGHLLEVFIFK